MSHGENGNPYGEKVWHRDAKRDGARETGAAAKARRIKGRKPKTRIAKRE